MVFDFLGSGSSLAGVIAGVTILGLCLVVLVVFAVVGGGSYRRSKRRRLMRTAPIITVHSPPEVSTTLTTHVPSSSQQTPATINSSSYPQNQSELKDCPPPYSAVTATTPGETVGHTTYEVGSSSHIVILVSIAQ